MKVHAPQEFNGAKLVGVFESGTSDWHEARAYSLGGSEIGTIMGLNPWESAYALWAKKTGKITSDFKENWAIRLGKAFEEPIVKLFQEEHPELEIYTCGTFASKDVDFMHANPDGLARHKETGEWYVLEIKTARYPWEAVPQHYVSQVQHYMDVLNIDKSYVVAVAGMDYKEYYIPADSFQQSVQRDAAFRFWQQLKNDQRPEWDGSDSTYQAVRRINPEIENKDVELGELGISLWNAQRRLDEAQAELNEFKSATLEVMGYARTAYVTVDDLPPVKVASRQMRGGSPALIIHKKGN
jgi:putative phage-type endonuclease